VKKIFAILICLFSLTMAYPITVSTTLSSSNTIYVDDDNIEGPWNGSKEHPFQRIQEGVDEADKGDTVFVSNGTYYENIIVNKSINIFGEHKNNTVIDGEYRKSIDIIFISEDHVDIKDFTIQRSGELGSGILLKECTENRISDCIFSSHYQSTIRLIRSSNNTISDCILKNNCNTGIKIGEGDFCNYNTISRCYIDTFRISLSIASSFNRISHCIVKNGISIFWGANNSIDTCCISDNDHGGYGIQIGYSTNNTLRNNTFDHCSIFFQCNFLYQYYHDIDTSNRIQGKPVCYLVNQENLELNDTCEIGFIGLISCQNITVNNLDLYGVALADSSLCTIDHCNFSDNYYGITVDLSTNNNIIDCGFSSLLVPIRIFNSSNITILNGNMSIGRPYGMGIDIDYFSYNITITGCIVKDFWYGIVVTDSDRILLSRCEVSGNQIGILFGSNSRITGCDIHDNDLGLVVEGSHNLIVRNNFINNTEHAGSTGSNKWNEDLQGNYWDDYIGLRCNFLDFLPYRIKGTFFSNIDWRPAIKPYNR
jgi:parallel beta-helix repeat protein